MKIPRNLKTLLVLSVWRTSSVFVVQTAHVPDEYWQSLEVAHRLAYGYGYLTWEWSTKIRSYIYPYLIYLLYKLLAILSLDIVILLTVLPRLFHALLAAYADYRFYRWTRNKWMLYSLCINWYWYYCASRTLINSLETSCTIIALSIFPWRNSGIRDIKFLWIVGFLCMVRPTAAVIWIPLCIYHLSNTLQSKIVLILRYSMVGIICFLLSTLLDIYYYKSFVISSWEFFRVNVLQTIGDTYGKEHLFWYIFSGLPVLLGLQFFTFIVAIWQITKHPAQFHREIIMLVTISWTLMVYSLLPHKEFRFLLPLLPMFIYVSSSCSVRVKIISMSLLRKIFLFLLVASNIIPGLYFSLIHQRGSLDVMKVLRNELSSANITSYDLLFLTPCHATPLYSHLHVNVSIRFLTCEPNLRNSFDYIDEADEFFAKPLSWIEQNYLDKNVSLPSHLIMFDNLPLRLEEFLQNYRLLAKIFHAHFPQRNYGQYISVYKHLESD